jgi:hypothetical protein
MTVESILFFFLILSTLNVINVSINILRALLPEQPKPLKLSGRALLYLGMSISYILTFIFKL